MKQVKNKNIDMLTSLLQVSIKKGKKNTSEKQFRKTLIYLNKTNPNINLINFLNNIKFKIQPAIKLQKKKFNYKPAYATEWYKINKASTWILSGLKKNKAKFYKAFASELLEINNETNFINKHRTALYQTATQNIYIKKKKN